MLWVRNRCASRNVVMVMEHGIAGRVVLPRRQQQDVPGHRRNVDEESFRSAFDVEESRTALVGPHRPFAGQQLT